MAQASIAGVGMTHFGKFPDRGVRSLTEEAVRIALADAGLEPRDVDHVYFGNAVSGLVTRQECVRGQVALRHAGFAGVPIVNVENACASGSTAFHLAVQAVASGEAQIALVVGAEKLTSPDKALTLAAFESALDQEEPPQFPDAGAAQAQRSVFMDVYAMLARRYMDAYGATQADFALISVKNHRAGALNAHAQYRDEVTVDEVVASRNIVFPLTLLMCSPFGDGAAALVVTTPERARRLNARAIDVRASVVVSGSGDSGLPPAAERASKTAYARAGIGPDEIDVFEVHDATAPAELLIYEELGMCPPGGGVALLRSGETALGGRRPVNSSGGLLSKGHPVGATGAAQLVELVEQLRGDAGARQRQGAKAGLAENGGGFVGDDVAACAVTILAA
jgi:acetyl-CoA acetyltransferase